MVITESLKADYENFLKIEPRIKRILSRDGITKFRDIQNEAFSKGLFEGKHFLIAAPSASGKTLIGELACIHENLKGNKAAYLVPLRALATEKYTSFSERYSELGIKVKVSTGDYDWDSEELANSDLFIMTYERFDSLLRLSPKWIHQFKVVVIDELHVIGDPNRGPRLESTIIRLRLKLPDVKVIGLSATIKNAEEIAAWMDAILIKSLYRPVTLTYQVIETQDKDATIKQLVSEIFNSNFQFIMFVRTRGEAIKHAKDIRDYIESSDLQDYATYNKMKEIFEPMHVNLTYSEKSLLQTIKKGVAYHHAGLSSEMRMLVEDLFRKNLVKIIVCTSTLAAGINIPARVVIIKDIAKYNFNRNYVPGVENPRMFKHEIKPNDFHQMVGRAGRPGLDQEGTGVILVQDQAEAEFIKNRYFLSDGSPKLEAIISSFVKDHALLEQVLVVLHEQGQLSEQEILEFFKKTLWWHQEPADHTKEDIAAFLEIGSLAAERIIENATLPEDKIEAIKLQNVKIRFNNCANTDAIEGVFLTDFPMSARISPEQVSCSCSRFTGELQKKTLCSHLYVLAQRAISYHYVTLKNMICTALNKQFILDRLTNFAMVKFVNGKYTCTKFGHLTVNLYLHPTLAVFIRAKLMSLKGPVSIFRLVRQIYEREVNLEVSNRYEELLMSVIMIETSMSFANFIIELSNQHKLQVGDIETFFDHAKWIMNAIMQVALFEGFGEVAKEIETIMLKFEFKD
ncbi:MAG: DEAD/DEAH box helicase [Candidatus Lokiarchaeota archaeon]|nr:DEAD/DEAH box helicase [Candidatus Lokiarchaeota archaeon]